LFFNPKDDRLTVITSIQVTLKGLNMSFGFRAEVGYDPVADSTFLKTNTPDFVEQITFPLIRGSEEDKQIRTLIEGRGAVGFRAEVGYNGDRDFTFLRTAIPDFKKQVVVSPVRGSEEDKQIRALLEDQGIVDFVAVNAPITLPINPEHTIHQFRSELYFGMEGIKENEFMGETYWSTIVPHVYHHVVLFGKQGSGAVNLMRLWLLWANVVKAHVVSIGNPADLYGTSSHLDPELTHVLDPDKPLREQFALLCNLGAYRVSSKLVFLVGADYEATDADDRKFLKEMQNNLKDDTYTFIHRTKLLESQDEYFTGSEGIYDFVSVAAIGDVNDATAKRVHPETPVRNARGVVWFSGRHNGLKLGPPKRVKTYLVPRDAFEQVAKLTVPPKRR
jgi:hypothetical protein